MTELTKISFDEYVQDKRGKQRPCLVMFHVNWCKVCQRTLPKYIGASGKVVEQGFPIDFAHVDCTDEKTLCQRYNVSGYPTIKLFPSEVGAEPVSFRGQRTEQGFLKYSERMTLPVLRAFPDAAALDTALSNETLACVVAAAGADSKAGLRKAAGRWRDRHVFALAPGSDLRKLLPGPLAATAPSNTTLAILSSGTQQWRSKNMDAAAKPAAVFYTGALDDFDAIDKWIEHNRFPGVWALDEGNFYEFTHANRHAAIVAIDPASFSNTQEEGLRASAAELQDDFVFGIVNGVSWADELRDFSIFAKDLPRVLVSEDNFDAWVEDVEELKLDTLERDLRSLLAGAPLLRQGRGALHKLFYYKREAVRFSKRVQAFAEQGYWQTAVACLGVITAVGTVMCLGWGLSACCCMIFRDDEEDLIYQAARARMEKQRMKKKD